MISRASARAAIRRLVPGAETITLCSRSGSDEAPAYAAYAIRNARFASFAGTEGGIGGFTASSLPTAQFKIQRQFLEAVSSPDPKIGDIIRRDSDGTRWAVQGVHMTLFQEAISLDVQEFKGAAPA